METGALIKQLSADIAQGQPGVALTGLLTGACLAAMVTTVLLVMMSFGPRADLATALLTWPVQLKFAASLTFGLGAYGVVSQTMRPDASHGALLLLLPGLVLIISALLSSPDEGRLAAAIAPAKCIAIIVALSIIPLFAVFTVIRRGATTQPALTGAAAGLLAGSVGAFCFALYCPIDTVALVGIWYTAAIITVTLTGAALGRWLLAW